MTAPVPARDTGRRRRIGVVVACVLAVAGLMAAAPTALGVPVDPQQRLELRQPSGESFDARPFGDEWYNGRETLGGWTVLRDRSSGAWEYAKKVDGRLVPSGLRPGRDRPAGLARHLRDENRSARRHEADGAALAAPGAGPSGGSADPSAPSGAPSPANLGTQRSLVILVQFADQPSLGTTAAQWNARFFGTSDSVSDYFDEVSYGRLAIAPALESHGSANDGVVGWLTLPTNHPNTQGNIGAPNQALTADAIRAADPYVDFGAYDTDGNGRVSEDELHITVIPAGWEASRSCGARAVWAHKWSTGTQTPVVDGVGAGLDYTQFGEKHCDSNGARPARQATLGVIVHELGHDLDLPDLYDTDKSSKGGVGYWSVMASGTWLALPNTDPGSMPSHPEAFSKSYQGWTTPQRLTGTATASLTQAATSPAVFQLLANPNGVDWTNHLGSGTGEYFLAENRQRAGYDRALPGCGILIWHVDETRPFLKPNDVDARRLVDLEEADNEDDPYDSTDAYLGARSFDEASSPNSNLYDGSESDVSARNFAATCSESMAAEFDGGDVTPPDTLLDGGPAEGSATESRDASFGFTATEADSSFECSLDGAAFSACVSPRPYTGLAVGAHTFSVRARDAAGNVDASPATRAWTIVPPPDRTAPETTITSAPAATTNATDAVFSFNASEPGRFECRLDGSAWGPCSSPQRYGGLGPGGHTFEVRAIDGAGNADASPAAHGWRVETRVEMVPPETPCLESAGAPARAKLGTVLKRGLPVALDWGGACQVKIALTVPRRQAVKLGLTRARRGAPVAIANGTLSRNSSGSATVKLSLSRKSRRPLGRLRSITLTLTVNAAAPGGGEPVSVGQPVKLTR